MERGLGGELYAGSIIRSGEAIALVQHIGMQTKFGKTADLVSGRFSFAPVLFLLRLMSS